jgi:hypothetical protein
MVNKEFIDNVLKEVKSHGAQLGRLTVLASKNIRKQLKSDALIGSEASAERVKNVLYKQMNLLQDEEIRGSALGGRILRDLSASLNDTKFESLKEINIYINHICDFLEVEGQKLQNLEPDFEILVQTNTCGYQRKIDRFLRTLVI